MDFRALKSLGIPAPGFNQPVMLFYLGSQGLQGHQMKVYGARADETSARITAPSFAHPAQQRAEHHNGGTHGRYICFRNTGPGDMAGVDDKAVAFVAASGSQILQYVHHTGHVPDDRYIGQDRNTSVKQRGCRHGQDCVFRTLYGYLPFQGSKTKNLNNRQ